jgi:hypothetical protein
MILSDPTENAIGEPSAVSVVKKLINEPPFISKWKL